MQEREGTRLLGNEYLRLNIDPSHLGRTHGSPEAPMSRFQRGFWHSTWPDVSMDEFGCDDVG